MNKSRDKFQVAISGISGRFPRSRNLNEFSRNLYEGVDMIDDEESRWKHFSSKIPKKFGKISDLEKFDASFFSYLDKHAAVTDPQTRMLLEHCYEAIVDSGTSPQSLFGKRVGVFVSAMTIDAKDIFFNSVPQRNGDGGTMIR
jgi:fatty acid synthase